MEKPDMTLAMLKDRVDENRRHCDHGKNNLTASLNHLAQQLGRANSAYESVQHSVSRLEDKTVSMEDRSISILDKLSENSHDHKSNSYLIKWMMGLVSVLIGGTVIGTITFLLNRTH